MWRGITANIDVLLVCLCVAGVVSLLFVMMMMVVVLFVLLNTCYKNSQYSSKCFSMAIIYLCLIPLSKQKRAVIGPQRNGI